MSQPRRAATRTPWETLQDVVRPASRHGAGHALRAAEDRVEPGAPRRVVRLLVPGVVAAVTVAGTAVALTRPDRNTQLEAVPAAAAAIPDRQVGTTSRSEQRLLRASQTPGATAMASATTVAKPSATAARQPAAARPSARPATPSPKPTATRTPAAPVAPTSTATPSTPASTGSIANCPQPSGWLGANAQRVYEASCRTFSFVTAYGGSRAGDPGPHGTGHAVDIMISGSRGTQIAEYMRAHAASLGITEVIYQQKIWTTQRASEGWRPMADRGSVTANHYDHVHVTVS